MTTLTRSDSRSANPPVYKDYVNFLAGYKNGKKEENKPDLCKKIVPSYNTYLENSKNQKFSSVKPVEETKKKPLMKSEIYIDIQPTKSVSEVTKVFQIKPETKGMDENDFHSKISIFEKSTKPKGKITGNRVLHRYQPLKEPEPVPPPLPENLSKVPAEGVCNIPPPPVLPETVPVGRKERDIPTPQLPEKVLGSDRNIPAGRKVPAEIDRNNPVVKKLVYGALRNMYGAYHDKATDMVSSLPKNMVVKSNGLQDRINQISATGTLDRLNGRTNPKLEE